MIAAVAANGVIGAEGSIPWRLPTDFAWFKRQTLGKPLIMGRKTFDSIGRALPGRRTIVVTGQSGWSAEGVEVAGSLGAALARGQEIAAETGAAEVMVGGGETLYRAAMPLADRLHITHVELSPDGDTRFPGIDPAEWTVEAVQDIVPTERDSAKFHIATYRRQRAARR
jgi:dihydrofolate reductase